LSKNIYIGVGTPQANPTVEVEFQHFMRGPIFPVFTRLTSRAEESADRLVEYINAMPDALQSYDTMPLAAFAFACTGSSYLVGAEREEAICEAMLQKHRIPIVTATQAIRRELEGRGAQRIAMLAPYPQPLCDAAISYWRALGFNIDVSQRIDIGADTRSIYALTDAEVAAAIADFDIGDADLLLLSGTGMPTIKALQDAPYPTISSNLCLAVEVLRRTQNWPPAEAADIHQLLGT